MKTFLRDLRTSLKTVTNIKEAGWWFWIGLLLRVALMPFFASSILRELFIPFLDWSVQNPGQNPWSHYPAYYFPYGTVQFLLLFIPKYVAAFFTKAALGYTGFSFFLVKLPLLVCDFVLFLTLLSVLPQHRKRLMFFYWLNPVVIYVSYVFGQLDVMAMAFCMVSIALLMRKQFALSGVFFALATLSKSHVLALVPFLLAYIWNHDFAKKAFQNISKWIAAWGGICALGFLPLAFASRLLYATATSPEAQRLLALRVEFLSGTVIYPIVFVFLAILGRLCMSTRISERGLLYGCGLILGSLVLMTEEFPGWHLWSLPFVAVFLASFPSLPRSLWLAYFVSYFIYFAGFGSLVASSPQLQLLRNVAATVLDLSYFGILLVMYRMGVRTEAALYGRTRPVLVGVAGDSGAGKNYFSHLCQDIFNPANTVLLEGDNYHKWERMDEKWRDYTHLNPRANHLLTMADHTVNLSRGLPVLQSEYNHQSGYFSAPKELKPSKTVIVQGLHTFYLRGMRKQFDLRIFLKPHESIRLAWKLQRDIAERNQTPETVLKSMERRETDSTQHISPQGQFSDWVIEFFPAKEISKEDILAGQKPELAVRYHLWNDAPVGKIVSALSSLPDCEAFFDDDYLVNSSERQIDRVAFTFCGNPTRDQIVDVASTCFSNIRQITRGSKPPEWRPGYDGVTQLVFLALLDSRRDAV